MPKTLRVRNVSPLGEVQSWLARRTFAHGEIVELDADVVGQPPSIRLLEEGEEPVAGHTIEVEGVTYYSDPGYGLLAQVEHFELVTEDDAPAAADPVPLDIPPAPAQAPVFVTGGQAAPAPASALDPAGPADSTTAPTAA